MNAQQMMTVYREQSAAQWNAALGAVGKSVSNLFCQVRFTNKFIMFTFTQQNLVG